MKIEKLMTVDVITCRAEDTLQTAIAQMREHDIGALPVVDNRSQVIGMITDRDAALVVAKADERPSLLRVGSFMNRTVVSCRPEDDLADAERQMQTAQLRRLPVIDNAGRLQGILSLNDIATAYSDTFDQHGVSSAEIARTLKAICAHRPVLSAA